MAHPNSSTVGATLIKINKRYPLGSDEHYMFSFLAKPLVGGTARSGLNGMTLLLMKQTVFDKQYGEESISLMRMLLLDCDDKKSSDMLMEFDTTSNRSPRVLFTGKTVDEASRMLYNYRYMLVYVSTNLEFGQRDDMISLLREEVDFEEKKNNFQTLLHLFEHATQGNIILPQKLDRLKDWLADCGRDDLIRYVNQFDPKKQFPGLVTPISESGAVAPEVERQCSDSTGQNSTTVPASGSKKLVDTGKQESGDSAFGEGDPRERSGSHPGDPGSSMASYRLSDQPSRFQQDSVEETACGDTELVIQRQNNISPNAHS